MMGRARFLIGLFVSILAMGTLACAAPSYDNETVAVRAGSQPVWSNDGSDADELLVTLRSSRAQLGEDEDAFLKASANNRSGKSLSVNMVLQLGNGLIISSTNSCSGDPCTGQFNLEDGIQGLMSMQVRSGGAVADSYSLVLHYDYTDPEGNKVRGKVEGLMGSIIRIQSVSASPQKSSSDDIPKTGQAVNPGNNRSSADGDTSTSDSAPPSTLPSKDGSGSANSELIVTSGWFIDPEISTGPLAIHQSPSLLSAPEFREAVSLGIQELQVGPGFFALPNWDSLYGANQDYDLARAKEMIAEIQVSLDSGFWPDSIDSMKVCVEALSGEMVQHEGTISDSLKNLGINIASPGSQDCDRIFLISVAPSTIPVEAPDVTDSSICGDIEGLTGKLMFDGRSNRTAIHELYQLDLDGCKVQVLQVPEGAGPFSYSPMRGSFVVTKPHSNIINNSDIWSFGGHSLQEKANLTNNGDHQFQSHSPDWSPDGNQIAYTQNNGVSASIIMVMNFDGTGKRRLEPFAGFPGAYDSGPGIDREGAPVWSPDGSKIAFVSSSSYLLPVNNEIYVVNSDGSDLIQLTKNGTANDLAPQWSPDGKKIVYQSDDDGSGRQGESNIWIVDAEGTGQPMVTIRLEGSETYPIWSPDGNKIAFKSNSNRNDGNNDIWVMDVDGSDVSRVTFTEEPFYLSESLRWIE